MATAVELDQTPQLIREAPASPAGPIDDAELAELPRPPLVQLPKVVQVLRFSQRQIEFVFRARRELGEVFRFRGMIPGGPVVTSHPDHVKSLFVAKSEQAPSLTGESPLLRAQGLSSRGMQPLILGEAAFVGISGLIAGTLVGAGLGLLLVHILKPLFILPPIATLPLGGAALLAGLVVVATLLSTLAALTILRRLSPSEVLREQ
jgi:hypothetical protein